MNFNLRKIIENLFEFFFKSKLYFRNANSDEMKSFDVYEKKMAYKVSTIYFFYVNGNNTYIWGVQIIAFTI